MVGPFCKCLDGLYLLPNLGTLIVSKSVRNYLIRHIGYLVVVIFTLPNIHNHTNHKFQSCLKIAADRYSTISKSVQLPST